MSHPNLLQEESQIVGISALLQCSREKLNLFCFAVWFCKLTVEVLNCQIKSDPDKFI